MIAKPMILFFFCLANLIYPCKWVEDNGKLCKNLIHYPQNVCRYHFDKALKQYTPAESMRLQIHYTMVNTVKEKPQ